MAEQSERKLKRLLEKAEELFWNYGYNAVSVDQIAAEAGISKMTIYKHFNSKEDLFIGVFRNSAEYYFNEIKKLVDEKYHTIEKIEALYNYSMELAKKYPAILIRDIMERKSLYERIAAIKLEMGLPLWQCILEDGIKKKEIRDLDLFFVSELLMNLPGAFKNSDYLSDKDRILKFYESFMDFIKFGLLGGVEKEVGEDAEKRTYEG